ncbi:osmotically-inducible protein OsmY [Aggregatibacter aphrophilus]|uniref:division/outer membrane stress-associated lipid-binding lipoprotein n=1 Tax=Aggregatibacter aphrophilus TaxID=732 RepID=UPI000DA4173A|nr:division/outer membrane stress-associated lipid-binding lipoprotein [Aggregatibacter aphrophilus]RDE92798.1 osmotically-inducible protein OsmY [Aggregatibacter aphrophilus]SQI98843.1 Osmotically-inducible protein Y precursor [Aggregatibacter aphrophilus]
MLTSPLKKLVLVLGSAMLLQGCVAAAIGGAAVAGATKVATDPRSMGTQLDDETLESRVNSAIKKDQQIKSEARISVTAYSGRVLLTGQVPNENLREVASSLTKGVQNVNDVYNEVRVGPKVDFAQISKDSWITSQIKSKMLVDSKVKTSDVKVVTENNEVFLMGNVTQDQGNAAAEIARNVAGVTKVIKVFNYLN